MAISAVLTFNSTSYDISNYIVKDSIEMDESLFTDLSPNTSACKLKLSRSCPYLDEIFEWNDSIQIAITNNGAAAFTGFLTDDPEMAVSPTGIGDVEISAEDPGIKLLKRAWTSTDGLATVFNGPVCDGTTPSTSFLHILAALAGVTLSSTLPTIAGTVDFSVADTDEDEYWDILEGVLSECLHTFYFNAAGELCLYALSGMQNTPTDYVTTQGTILSEGGTKPGIIVKKRRYNYREITVEFDETETVASEIVFKDTTNQSATHDCVISLSPGEYYPPTCDASTYAYIDYFLEDKRDLVSVASAASDFIYETGIVSEFTHLGKRARVRFYNGAATQKTITQIRVVGTGVVAVSSKSKQICGEAGKAKKKVTAKYIHAKADALALGNLLYYYYKNSASTYEFRSYLGTLYPATTLFPSTSLYPMGDPLSLGEIVRIYDPLWTGLDVNVVITGKQYILGRDGATYTAEGVNTINLGDIGTYVARTPATVPNVQKYPAEKPLASTSDAVDFDGQYGIYGGQRYVGTMPATWVRDDAGLTADEVAAMAGIKHLSALTDPVDYDGQQAMYKWKLYTGDYTNQTWALTSGLQTVDEIAGIAGNAAIAASVERITPLFSFRALFTSSGNWTVPANTKWARITACGGGGGGAGGEALGYNNSLGWVHGNNGGNGGNGGNTSFGSYLTANGGGGGVGGSSPAGGDGGSGVDPTGTEISGGFDGGDGAFTPPGYLGDTGGGIAGTVELGTMDLSYQKTNLPATLASKKGQTFSPPGEGGAGSNGGGGTGGAGHDMTYISYEDTRKGGGGGGHGAIRQITIQLAEDSGDTIAVTIGTAGVAGAGGALTPDMNIAEARSTGHGGGAGGVGWVIIEY